PCACTIPATDGMVVKTDTEQLQEFRRGVLQLILGESRHICLVCSADGRCELQQVANYIGAKGISLPHTFKEAPFYDKEPFFDRDYNLCILCGRCVRICQEVRGAGTLAFTYRGSQALVGTAFGRPLQESGCQFCGACVDVCPTGTLMERSRKWLGPSAERKLLTTCPYCGVGCQLELQVKDGKIIEVIPDENNDVNRGQACVKGRFGIQEFVHSPERLTTPLIKKGEKFVESSWDEALDLVASKLGGYNPDEMAVIGSAKATNEDNYVTQKLGRAVLGTNNIDHSGRLCHSPSVAGLTTAFGSGAMTNSIQDIGNAACILAIGTNTTATHPVIGLEIKKATFNGGKLIVANPREIGLVRFADIWLQLKPGTDAALLMGMMRVIVDEGLLNSEFIEQHCENFETFKDSLKSFELDSVEKITGVPKDKVAAAARLFAGNNPATILYAMGITQHTHGTDNVLAIANLAMLTGNIGRQSTGVYPLRGQNNSQGAGDLGSLPDVYPGYQPVEDKAAREKFEKAWATNLNPSRGLTLTEIFRAAGDGQIKAIYLTGENPVLSNPDASQIVKALGKLEFLVVRDVFLTETAELADVVLPAASFAETDGTFTNTERRVQRVRKAIEPVGDSLPDWEITCRIARKMGSEGFDFENPSQIMDEIASLTPIYGGISYSRLEDSGLQWPCSTKDHPGTPVLHIDSFTRGKGRFTPLEYLPSAELPDEEYPLILTTARSLYHNQSGTMTRKVKALNELQGEELVDINPEDAGGLNIADGDTVKVTSRRGQVTAKAKLTDICPTGVVSMDFHFRESPVNVLTNPALDPVAKTPELKVCAVRLEKNSKK
ncbi:MAG: formate dehydrogenase subunit alpha, partial [Dehalococcoidales bacterium]